jgi:hypothetical protein
MHHFCEKLEITMCNDCRHLKMKRNICFQCVKEQEMVLINQNKLIQEVLLFENETNKKEAVCFLH